MQLTPSSQREVRVRGNMSVLPGRSQLVHMMDAWEQWRVVCLAALSVEDVEDIYVFGTVITGFLLFGLGATLIYRKIKETATAVISPLRLPEMIDALGRVVGTQTVASNSQMDNKEMFTAMQMKLDRIEDLLQKVVTKMG